MSQENVEIVRSMFEPFDGVDVAEMDWGSEPIREILENHYSPDVELTTLTSGIGIGPSRVYNGWDGVVSYLQEWIEPFSEYRVALLDYIEAGDHVLTPVRARGIGAMSGAAVELEFTIAYKFQDDKITRVAEYDTVDLALEAIKNAA